LILDLQKLLIARRALWVTELGIENKADIPGKGGDAEKDWLRDEWSLKAGQEVDTRKNQ